MKYLVFLRVSFKGLGQNGPPFLAIVLYANVGGRGTLQRIQQQRNKQCKGDLGFPMLGDRMMVVSINSLKLDGLKMEKRFSMKKVEFLLGKQSKNSLVVEIDEKRIAVGLCLADGFGPGILVGFVVENSSENAGAHVSFWDVFHQC